MDENGKRLLEIHRIDSEIVELERQMAAYPKRIQMLESEAARAHAQLDEALQRRKELRARRALLETEVAQKQESIRKFLNQQMLVKTNKEYQAVTHQIDTVRQAIGEQETGVLEAMEEEDGREAQIAELRDAVQHADREAETEKARIRVLEGEKRDRLKSLKRERGVYMQQLPEDLTETYRVLLIRFPGSAIVPTDGQTCGGCHMNLLALTVQQLNEKGTLVPCSHCRRLLYLSGS